MMKRSTFKRLFVGLISLLFLAQPLISARVAHAMTKGAVNGIIAGTPHYDAANVCDVAAVAVGGAAAAVAAGKTIEAGKSVYILGDSITVRTAPAYKAAFKDKQIDVNISAVSGRSWESPGNPAQGAVGTQGPAKTAIETDKGLITPATVGGVIIALGTNGYTGGNPIDTIIKKVREINPNVPVWWVNVANVDNHAPGVVDFNTKLDAAAKANNFSVIPWAKTVDPDGDGTKNPKGILEDGTHPWIGTGSNAKPHPDGTKLLADLAVTTTTGTTPGADAAKAAVTSTCCSPGPAATVTGQATPAPAGASDTEKNKAEIWGYLIGEAKFTDFQAAGIMGNMQNESGFNPRRVEGTTTPGGDSDTPGSRGYGIVQWTPGTQLIGPALAAHTTPSNLRFQLDYLMEELRGSEKAAYADLLKSTDVATATVSFETKFERHFGPPQPDRITVAQKIFDQFKGTTGTASASLASCGSKSAPAGDGSFNGYFQFDPQWKSHPYPSSNNSPGTIGNNGCGITSMATIINTLTGNRGVTPISLADELVSDGLMSTVSSLVPFTKLPAKYGLKTTQLAKADFQKGLDIVKNSNGNAYMIANVGAGYWTSGGHYFVIRGQTADNQVQVWDVGETTAKHPKTDKTYPVDFMLSSQTNAINWFVISK